MKKITIAMIIVGLAALLVGFCPRKTTLYPMTTVVVDVNEKTDTVTCVDFNGYEWQFTGTEDWLVGDFASMIMNDNGTEIVLDDTIESVKYNGWLVGSWGLDQYGNKIIEITY